MSLCFPKVNPSYQSFTSSFFSDKPASSNASKTSLSVKPKLVLYSSFVVVITLRLFKSEKILSFDTLVIPVIMALSRYGFVFNVELKKLRINPTISFQNPFTYASCIGVSYSSRSIITFFSNFLYKIAARSLTDLYIISFDISLFTFVFFE